MIKGLIFDYGGTLDSNGEHWASVIYDAYQSEGIYLAEEVYEHAYVYGERKMATHPLILPEYNFRQVLETKITAQFDFLQNSGILLPQDKIASISAHAYTVAYRHVQKSKELLKTIHPHIKMVIVSNFYGNLKAVLQDFGILHYFDHIVESAVVGIRKPDPQIFSLGIDALRVHAKECLVIGDSYRKDIVPAKSCGCTTLWLKGKGWRDETDLSDESAADHIVTGFDEMSALIHEAIHKI